MKKISIITTLAFALTLSINTFAQSPPPPPPDHGETGNQNGGNAPIGSGLAILIGLGAAYAGKKYYVSRKEDIEE